LADGAGRGGDSNLLTLAAEAFNTVAGGEEGVEALDEGGVASEERRDAVNDTGGVNAVGGKTGGEREMVDEMQDATSTSPKEGSKVISFG
jgi:hypothetical protein